MQLPHILVPGHVWKSIFPLRFDLILFTHLLDVGGFQNRVFTDETGVQQDDVWAQDGLDHLQELGVFGQTHDPGILKMNIVEAVLSVLFTCTYKYITCMKY